MNKFEEFKKDKSKKSLKERTKNSLAENMDAFVFRNVKQLSMGSIELINNTLFHGFDTLKVRLQAKNMRDDTSLFYKNKVQLKPLISGVTSAGVGSFLAGFCFVYVNENFLHYLFRKNKGKSSPFDIHNRLDWKGKLITSYILSDIIKTSIFLPFEARKQRIQLYHNLNELGLANISKFMMRAYLPILLRDIIFRVITLSSFLNNLNVQHQPTLKYNLNEIKDYIRQKEKNRESINVSYFMDYSKFQIFSPFPVIILNLVLCTIFATVLTHPLDVISTKILTQTRLKYRGMFSSFQLIAKEEGLKKLFLSGLSARISFNIFSAMSVLLLFENMNSVVNKYYQNED